MLELALANLTVEHREILLMYHLGDWSYREMAAALRVPVGTIMSRLSRAKRRLEEEFIKLREREE